MGVVGSAAWEANQPSVGWALTGAGRLVRLAVQHINSWRYGTDHNCETMARHLIPCEAVVWRPAHRWRGKLRGLAATLTTGPCSARQTRPGGKSAAMVVPVRTTGRV